VKCARFTATGAAQQGRKGQNRAQLSGKCHFGAKVLDAGALRMPACSFQVPKTGGKPMKRSLLAIGLSAALLSLVALSPASADPTSASEAPVTSAQIVTAQSSSSAGNVWLPLLLLVIVAAAAAS
tara:strand:+ start:433 stop:807 length:375 start_codon:yes stop_codon:yes gene_type:complete